MAELPAYEGIHRPLKFFRPNKLRSSELLRKILRLVEEKEFLELAVKAEKKVSEDTLTVASSWLKNQEL